MQNEIKPTFHALRMVYLKGIAVLSLGHGVTKSFPSNPMKHEI